MYNLIFSKVSYWFNWKTNEDEEFVTYQKVTQWETIKLRRKNYISGNICKHPYAYISIYMCVYPCTSLLVYICLCICICVYIYIVAQLVKNLPAMGRPGFDPWIGKIPWRRERPPTPVLWPGEFLGLYSPWGHKESNTAEWLSHLHINLCKSATKHEITS